MEDIEWRLLDYDESLFCSKIRGEGGGGGGGNKHDIRRASPSRATKPQIERGHQKASETARLLVSVLLAA